MHLKAITNKKNKKNNITHDKIQRVHKAHMHLPEAIGRAIENHDQTNNYHADLQHNNLQETNNSNYVFLEQP